MTVIGMLIRKAMADKHSGYTVYDWNGKAVYGAEVSGGSGSTGEFSCFLASNFPHFHRYDSLKSALYIHAVSKNINTFPKNQGRIRAAIAVEILDFTVMYR